MHSQSYFEAILQLRPFDEKIMQFILNRVEERKKNVFISKIVNLKTGVDIYLSDNSFTLGLGKKLKKVFKGKLILSRKLHTRDRQTSKDLYRVTVCFRLERNED